MEIVQKLFNTTDLYAVINVTAEKAADPKALKAGYIKAALATHPDKGTEDERELRTQKFQIVKKIYELMQDDDLRKSYDETGEWPDEEDLNIDLASYGRLDENAILEFKKLYIGSDEEKQDVKKYYEESKGNILDVLDNVFFANILDDEARIQGIIDDLIKSGEMEKMGGSPTEKARQRKILKAKKEAKEAEECQKELKLDGGLESLRLAMAKNSAKRGNFLDDLEKKYGGAEKNGKSKKVSKNKHDDEEDLSQVPKSKKNKSSSTSSASTRSTRSSAK